MKTHRGRLFALMAIPLLVSCSSVRDRHRGDQWIHHVPDLHQPALPVPPERGRPVMAKPLSERTHLFDGIVVGKELRTRVIAVGDNVFVGVLEVEVQEVLKGEKAKGHAELEIVLCRWHDGSALERILAGNPGSRRGIWGLKALPDGAPFSYVQLWFNVPSGENWEPVLAQFREDIKKKGTAQQSPAGDVLKAAPEE